MQINYVLIEGFGLEEGIRTHKKDISMVTIAFN